MREISEFGKINPMYKDLSKLQRARDEFLKHLAKCDICRTTFLGTLMNPPVTAMLFGKETAAKMMSAATNLGVISLRETLGDEALGLTDKDGEAANPDERLGLGLGLNLSSLGGSPN